MWPFSAFFHPDIAIALLWSFLLWSVRGFDKTVKTLVLFVDLRRTALLFIFLHFTIISITHKGFIDFTGVVALLHKTSKICLFLPVCPAMHSSRLGLATVRKQRLPKLCWRWTMVFECIVLFCTAYDTCIYIGYMIVCVLSIYCIYVWFYALDGLLPAGMSWDSCDPVGWLVSDRRAYDASPESRRRSWNFSWAFGMLEQTFASGRNTKNFPSIRQSFL